MPAAPAAAVPRLTYLRIRNYRALHDLELRDLTPLAVLVGPNGSGKSTMLDPLTFLAEAVSGNLRDVLREGKNYLGEGKPKSEWAETITPHLDPARNQSASFRYFVAGLRAL